MCQLLLMMGQITKLSIFIAESKSNFLIKFRFQISKFNSEQISCKQSNKIFYLFQFDLKEIVQYSYSGFQSQLLQLFGFRFFSTMDFYSTSQSGYIIYCEQFSQLIRWGSSFKPLSIGIPTVKF
ncbi:hypothetical protein TTHERM_000035269 (macronuclear) [Tetrahymena thermophila SB210]|uniref:Uncharacterized protein n=1 Tax=Tetrahymena thermophila (strain SB210) TaxID=312017 RepID=W7XKF9_TETTS|nr:hypothetical protein TTHERM_000035269 [Tetrahymena thermophila SB210]EWS74869.1 hypothetical protein TTHERM_000035269 [Tetrahymena thermophila SB210]|eukprot:XP_012652582.1 hypothetical protein TTHERM_000035269 [Tetrahymena thermophila SB210]